eukprot:s1502_g20.t1
MVLGAVHGACMPMAFFFLSDLYQAVYMPNDDGSLPPVHAPHTIRDSKVAEVGLTYVLLALVVLVARTGGCYLVIKAADRQVVAARRQYFYQILMQGPSWHDMHNASELAPQLVQDTHLFRDGIGERLVDFTRACFMAVSATVLACSRDWKVSILMAIIMPIAGMCMALSVEVVRNFSTVVEACYAKAGQVAVTATELIKTVTAFNGQRLELEAFNGHVDEAHINAIQTAKDIAPQVLITGMSLGVYFGSQWVLQDYETDCWRASPPFGNCRTGGTIMYTIIWGFTMGLGTMNMCFVAFANARAAMHRIGNILDEPLSATSGGKILPHVEGEIIFSDVFFAYPKRTDSRSTLVGLLLRFYEPKTGTVCLDGTDVRALELQWFRSKLALEPVLFQDTIYENIAAGSANSVTKADVEQAIPQEFCVIAPVARGRVKHIDKVGEAGAQLSGGQKQRLAIARALIRKPAVLLLDEATSALDSASERAVQKALDELLEVGGRTTIVIAHRLSTVRNAHQICVLDKGKVVEQGTHEDIASRCELGRLCAETRLRRQELMSKQGAYEKLLRLQILHAAKDGDVPPEEEETTTVLPAQAPAVPAAPGAQALLEATSSKEPDANDQAQGFLQGRVQRSLRAKHGAGKTDEDRCLKLAKSYDFEKDLGTAFAVKEVWKMSKQDYKYYMIGVGFTLLGSMVMPYFSVQFARTINIFNQPPAVLDPVSHNWYAAYNEPFIAASVTNLCMLMQALSVFWLLQAIGASWAFAKAGELLTLRVRARFFEALLRQEISWHDKQGTAHLLWKLGADVPSLKSLVGANIAGAANFGFTTVIGVGVAMYFSWRFCLCILILIPLLGISAIGVGLNMRKIDGDYSSGVVSEAVNCVKTVTAFGLQGRLMEKYETKLESHMEDEQRIRRISALGTGVASAGVFMILAMAVFGINVFISRGMMQVDIATIVIMVLVTTVSAFGELARLVTDTSLPQESARRVFNIIARKSKIDPFSDEGLKLQQVSGKVEFRKVHFRYATRPNLAVFNGLSFTIEPCTTTALVGPSGCGKSTAVGLLQRFYDPLDGCILFDGHDLRNLNLAWLRAQMTLDQFQPERMKHATMEEVEAAAKAANATDFLNTMPQGFSTQAGHRGAHLSGGQKQRIAIARALLRDPAVLLLDEATSSLDAVSERLVQDALDRLVRSKPRTTIIIAHRLSTVRSADQICVFSHGEIVETGRHEQLMELDGHYSKLVAAQQISAQQYAAERTPASDRRFYPEPQKGLLLQPVYPLDDLPKQIWYPASDLPTGVKSVDEVEPEPEAVKDKVPAPPELSAAHADQAMASPELFLQALQLQQLQALQALQASFPMVGAVPAAATDAVAAASNPVALATLPGALPFAALAAPVAATDAMNASLYPSGNKVKTQMCRFYPFGTCSKGEACAFAHTETELGKPVVEAGTEIAPTPASKVMRAGDWILGVVGGENVIEMKTQENDASRETCQRCNSAKANANLTEKMEASSTAKGGPYGKGGSDGGGVSGKGGQGGWWDGQWDGQPASQSEDPIVSALVQAVDILAGMAGGAPMASHKQREGDWYCDCGNYNFESRVKCNKHSCGKIRPGFVDGDWLCRRRECKAKNSKVNEVCTGCGIPRPIGS